MGRIGPPTFPLPRECSATELHRQSSGQGGTCTPEGRSHLIYSQARLTTLVLARYESILANFLLFFNNLFSLISPFPYFFMVSG